MHEEDQRRYAGQNDGREAIERIEIQLVQVGIDRKGRKRAANPSCQVAPGQLAVGATQRCGNNSSSREFGQVGNLVNTSLR